MKTQEATMFMITLKSGITHLINDYKLFDDSGIEPENYAEADYNNFKYLVEVFSDENTQPIKGKSFVCCDIANIK